MNSLKKIYDIEITPPAGAWQAIAKELEQWDEYKKFSKNINGISVNPPANLWNNIVIKLDETEQEQTIANSLYNLQVEAPPIVWENINKELDDQTALEIIEKKLSNIQVAPPASVWHQIERELKSKNANQPLVVPISHGWLKYAAAACIIGILSISAFFIFSDNDNNNSDYTAGANSKKEDKLSIPNINHTKDVAQKPNTTNPKTKVLESIRTQLGNAYSISMEKNAELQNRYIILMTQDGNIVRMSKKVSNMADCIAGEDNSCDSQITKWQKEMASSSSASSSDNFLDILDMASNEKNAESLKKKL